MLKVMDTDDKEAQLKHLQKMNKAAVGYTDLLLELEAEKVEQKIKRDIISINVILSDDRNEKTKAYHMGGGW